MTHALNPQNGKGSTPGESGLETLCTVSAIDVDGKSMGFHGAATSDSTLTECGNPVNSSSALANAFSICATDTAASDASIPMDRDSFKRMIHFLMVIFNRQMSDFEMVEECYWHVLKDYDGKHLRNVAYQIGKYGKSFPLPCAFATSDEGGAV